tara:strand:+ start:1877 stop:2557 length:681 start_codon:yes stop_codon:yes gene_type:complete
MGIVIFTRDETFQEDWNILHGNVVIMRNEIDSPMTDPDTTFILYSDKFKNKDVKEWLPHIGNRLIVVTSKKPTISANEKPYVIIHPSLTGDKDSLLVGINAILQWPDRRRVWVSQKGMPIPYALAFLRENVDDIDFWRLVAKANMQMSDDIVRSIFAYGITGKRSKVKWPKKKKAEDMAPFPFRQSDLYWREIVTNFIPATNDLRARGDTLPKGVRKTSEQVTEWI